VSGVDGLAATPTSHGTGASTPPVTTPGVEPTTTTTTTAPDAGSGSSPGAPGPAGAPVGAVGDVPAAYVAWMKAAVAAECPGLSWTVLAGIGKVESDFGRSTLPGVRSGANPMGAEGPMQFEPATFAAYGTVAPGGADPASPYDPADAIYSAARLLCADGGGDPARLYSAIFDYNHSDAYVTLVVAYANAYSQMASGAPGQVGLGSVIVADAEAYLGTPYVWGGEKPGVGFDCSGLVQWVYAEAGISLPRVAQDQYDAGPHLPAGATLYPGDLVFFGGGPTDVEHVGIYVGHGEMIDAPYTGAVVRFDRVSTVPLGFVGATRPEIPDMSVGSGVPVITPDGQPGGRSDSDGGGNGGHGPGSAGNGSHHGGGGTTGPTHTGHHPTTTTTAGGGTTTTPPRPGRRHRTTTTTTTTTTVPTTTSTTDPTTTSTSPPGRHHPTTTTTTTPPTTTTTSPTTTTSTTSTSTSTPTTTTTTASTGTTTTTTTTTTTASPPARHHS